MFKSLSLQKNKLMMLGSAALLTAAMIAIPGLNSVVKADNTDYTIYVAVDQSVIGGSAPIQPVAYTTDDTSKTIGDVLNAVKGSTAINIIPSAYGSYLAGVGSTYSNSYNFSSYTGTLTAPCTNTNMVSTDQTDSVLTQKEFTGVSGWMFGIDSQTYGTRSSNSQTAYYSMDTTIADLLDTGVLTATDTDTTLRCYYSLNMGADLGMAYSSWLPTNQPTFDGTAWVYDWNNTTYEAPSFTWANKDALVKTMANYADKTDSNYEDALAVLDDVDALSSDVTTAIAGLI